MIALCSNFSRMTEKETGGRELPEAKRLRALRRAEGYTNAAAWAAKLGWTATQLSNFENGSRRVPRDAALTIKRVVQGFNVDWLWTGDESGLSVALRDRIHRAEELESSSEKKIAS